MKRNAITDSLFIIKREKHADAHRKIKGRGSVCHQRVSVNEGRIHNRGKWIPRALNSKAASAVCDCNGAMQSKHNPGCTSFGTR